ncbi:MAG: serine hydrolase [Ignavibacteriaceae bacterium]
MFRKILFLLFILLTNVFTYSQIEKNVLEELLQKNKSDFGDIISNPNKFRLQIIYTQINRDEDNKPTFVTYKFGVDKDKYFYPASTVKFPAALLALEKLKTLSYVINRDTKYSIDSDYYNKVDTSGEMIRNYFTIAEDIKKIFLVSDNEAFNHLYEFLGQKELNEGLWIKRYSDVKLIHRLSRQLSNQENRSTFGLKFEKEGKELFSSPGLLNMVQYKNSIGDLLQGIGYYSGGNLKNEPMDFTYKNFLSLETQHCMLKAILFPKYVPVEMMININEDDRMFALKYMSMFPGESEFKEFQDTAHYPDNYVKFFFNNTMKDKNLRIFNKVGQAYGYLIDNAYIADFEEGIEFLLSAVIYVNSDEIFNDDKYEYDETGFPFLEKLGKAIYEYEAGRERDYKPDLKGFKFEY